MKRKIIVNNKEFTMPKMSIDTYTEYLELAEHCRRKTEVFKAGH